MSFLNLPPEILHNSMAELSPISPHFEAALNSCLAQLKSHNGCESIMTKSLSSSILLNNGIVHHGRRPLLTNCFAEIQSKLKSNGLSLLCGGVVASKDDSVDCHVFFVCGIKGCEFVVKPDTW